MGWKLSFIPRVCIERVSDQFATDREAAEWVVNVMEDPETIRPSAKDTRYPKYITCRKALLPCVTGGAS